MQKDKCLFTPVVLIARREPPLAARPFKKALPLAEQAEDTDTNSEDDSLLQFSRPQLE